MGHVHSKRTTLYWGIVTTFATVAVWIWTGLICGETLVALGERPYRQSHLGNTPSSGGPEGGGGLDRDSLTRVWRRRILHQFS